MVNRLRAFVVLAACLCWAFPSWAKDVSYDLTVDHQSVNFTGKTVQAMTVNGGIPGPVLRWTEGDQAVVRVHNKMNVETSIHWHGILLPNREDGVSYLTTPPIRPGATHTFRFPIVQSGTYWYHSHTGLQEQRGVYGAIVIQPKHKKQTNLSKPPENDEVLVLSDWTDENPHEVLRTLKRGSDYYSLKKKNMPSLFGAIQKKSFGAYLKNSVTMMPPMDVSDVGYDAFLVNGKREGSSRAKPGRWVRLRVVNASASTYFYLQFAKGPLKIIAADGLDIVPFETDRLLIAVAETYDLLLQVPDDGRYELKVTSQDGSGSTSYFLGEGREVRAPCIPGPSLYKMEHDMSAMLGAPAGGHGGHEGHAGHGSHESHGSGNNPRPGAPYPRIQSPRSTALDPKRPLREVTLNLTGDMHRYLWTFNGKTLNEEDTIPVKKGENVRFHLINKTMMNHPIHLHGHFFRVVNAHGDYSPLKHTVDVPPHGRVVIEFEADNEKDWFFHCHILYHMMSGMHRIVHYEGTQVDPDVAAMRHHLYHHHFYSWGEVSALSQMSEGSFQLSNDRNDLITEWQANWKGDFEIEGTYNRYFNRYLSLFGGVEGTDRDVTGIFGARVLLPLLLEGTARIDTEGDFQFSLARALTLFPRLMAFGRIEYDTETHWEWKAGGEIPILKHFSLTGQYHSEYGAGGGVKFIF